MIVRSSLKDVSVLHNARLLSGSTPEVHSSTKTTTHPPKSQNPHHTLKTRKSPLLDPPRSPIANCSFLFCPPESVAAFACIFFPKSQSLNNASRSSSAAELSVHFTACHTLNVWIHVSSENKTFFWGTIPMVPLGGRERPPSNVIVPRVWPIKPPMTERAVDFPALSSFVS